MKRRGQNILLIVTVCAAVLVLTLFGTQLNDEPSYTVFSTEEDGVSLLMETLSRMGYPVAVVYTPVDETAGVNDVQIIIKPDNPALDDAAVNKILDWVRRGGRLIYMDNDFPTAIDTALFNLDYAELGNLTHYYVGQGEVVTGYAEDIVNESLLYNSQYGMLVQYTLEAWKARQVYFNEYYHGYRANDSLFVRLPVVVKLVVVQCIILAAVYAWYKGKRFGKPVPYYEETEREENEQVKATARLYGKYIK